MTDPNAISQIYIADEEGLKRLIAPIKENPRVALDIEADSLHHYYAKICLIQLTLDGKNYIVDPLAGLDLTPLITALSTKPLILHGGDYDMRMLHTSFKFRPKSPLFDTMIAAQLLGYEQVGLSALVQRLFNVTLSKKIQKSNWAQRPLSEEQLAYAVKDTQYLIPLADFLRKELRKRGREEWHRESCEHMVNAALTNTNPQNPDEVWRIRGAGNLSRRELELLRRIWHWREREAQKTDIPAFKIMMNHLILDLAQWSALNPDLPIEQGPKLPRNCKGKRLKKLKAAIERAHRVPDHKLPAIKKGRRVREETPHFSRVFESLKGECSRFGKDLGIPPAIIAPRSALSAITLHRPQSIEEIMSRGQLMKWQAELIQPIIHKTFQK